MADTTTPAPQTPAPQTPAPQAPKPAPKHRYFKLPHASEHQRFNHDDDLKGGAAPKPGTPKQQLSAKVSVWDMVVYGLIEMVPIAPFAIFAAVFMASNGMPTIAYLIGLVGMIFTVFSFGVMIPLFPSSGSIYTYASHTLHPSIGFVAGWLMLLQYLITPDLMFIQAGQALNQYVPGVPVWGWCLIFIAFVAFVSVRKLGDTIRIDKIALVAEIIVFAMFIVFGVVYIIQHPSTSSFSLAALFDPAKFQMGSMMNAVSLCAMSFVGFGCVATLTEEAKNPKTGPSKSMLIIVLILGAMFMLMCYVGTCVDPSGSVLNGHPNTGFYLLAGKVGGEWFGVVCAVANALALGVFNGLVSTTSISRVIYVMSRSGALPKELGIFDKKTEVPISATIFVNVLSLALLFLLINFGMTQVAKISNFGALSTYCLLNICVIWYCFIKKRQKLNIVRALIFPALGALVTGAIFFSIDFQVALIGWIWVALGIIYYLVQTKVFKHEINLG